MLLLYLRLIVDGSGTAYKSKYTLDTRNCLSVPSRSGTDAVARLMRDKLHVYRPVWAVQTTSLLGLPRWCTGT